MKKAHATKISVIGVGHVGSLTGFLLAMRGLATEIVLCARDGTDAKAVESQKRAEAEALDIRHAIAFTSHRLEIRAGTSADTRDSDILVIAASEKMPPKADAIRDILAVRNSALMRQIIPRLAKLSPHAIIVNVANPVDVITYHIHQASGFDWRKVIGTGTLLDTLRFRRRISDEMDVFAGDVRTYILGEHGPSSVTMLAHATVGGTNLGRLVDAMGIHDAMLTEAEQEAKKIGSEIFRTRGYTNYAVAMAVEMIVDSIVRDRSMTLPVSVYLDGFYGLDDVCLSLPCVISRRGIRQRLKPELSEQEKAQLRHSAAVIREVIEKTRETKVVE